MEGLGSTESTTARGVIHSGLPQQDVNLLRRLLIGGYLVAAGTGGLAFVMPGSDQGNVGLGRVTIAALAISVTLALGRRLPQTVIKLIGFAGAILLASVLV